MDSNNRTVFIKKDGNEYSLNGLSDGEKCILFYIGNALVAPSKSYIVVDKPETFLNTAIYNKLWDLIISARPDCQFVFTSHTMDFINARTNTTFVWCKGFSYPNQFNLQILNNDLEFPMSLLTELVGSRKPILFCEGTYDSIDYKIFSKIFINDYFVKPVSGHKDVISYTKGYNALNSVHGNIAVGIVDGDFMDDTVVEKLKDTSVFVLPFNEIEMLLITEPVIKAVLGLFEKEPDLNKMIEQFKSEFFNEISASKDKIILESTKKIVDRYIEGSLVENTKSLDSIIDEVEKISLGIDIRELFFENKKALEDVIESRDYFKALKICNLKGQIINGLGNKSLMPKYRDIALKRVAIDEGLQDLIRMKYFSEITIGSV